MKFLHLFVIVLYLSASCLDRTGAVSNCIQCFNCPESFTPNTQGTPCAPGMDTCMKTMIKFPGGSMITKACASASGCSQTNFNLFGMGYWMMCCNNVDNCNSAVSLGQMGSSLFLKLAASTVAFLALVL